MTDSEVKRIVGRFKVIEEHIWISILRIELMQNQINSLNERVNELTRKRLIKKRKDSNEN